MGRGELTETPAAPTLRSGALSYEQSWSELESKLREIGGERIVNPGIEEDALKLIRRGETRAGDQVRLRPGRPSQCHSNAAQLYEMGEGEIATGYALSDDGIWRQHSWLISPSGEIVETTEPRELYFGFTLDEAEAEDFASENF